jgi:hypothetical protein
LTDKQPPFAFTDVVHEKTAQYYRTWAAAAAAIEEIRNQDEVVNVTGPSPTGPWHAQWWRRFPDGYRIDIEERRQWQGRGSRGGEDCYLCRSPEPDTAWNSKSASPDLVTISQNIADTKKLPKTDDEPVDFAVLRSTC